MAKRRRRRANWLMRVVVLCSIVCVAVSLISMQVEVTSKRRHLAAIEREIYRQEMENAEIKRILDGGTDREYIERVARDKLGYAYPDEKIFIDRSGG